VQNFAEYTVVRKNNKVAQNYANIAFSSAVAAATASVKHSSVKVIK